MKYKFIKTANFLIISFMAVAPLVALALPLVPCGTADKPCTVACFYVMINRIINFILWNIATPLSATAIMVAGIMLVLGGSEKAIATGKEILKFTLYGLFFAFASWLIIEMVLRGLLNDSFFKVWNKFPDKC
jgi:hypothetical protein